ncbi:trypsin Inhibitor like cysteine rich domain protein [Necator americanus]|uniref:Trypsin Inhibitor like cysteine rich domain protein n=1 Tax=Necator americanus TaxID=51031 RepID=W2TUZ3_NECAM|nr:trypsin Inhibitor like cysteine rich domain protein [Necator americanus]ETN85920.1 trypsin Inhibitor like cysteine rich domain protein [Necator americanus]
MYILFHKKEKQTKSRKKGTLSAPEEWVLDRFIRECNAQPCGLHEEFKKCANCEPTCERKQKPCANECLTPACQCVQGYVRHRGRCIKSENCEKFANYGKFSKRFFPNT